MMRLRVATVEHLFGDHDPEVAECLMYLGWLLMDLGRAAEAEPCFERARIIREDTFGVEHPGTRQSLDSLVGATMELGDYKRAESLLRQELAMSRAEYGVTTPDMASLLICLSECMRVRGEAWEAFDLMERAVGIMEAHGEEDAEDLALARARLEELRPGADDEPGCGEEDGEGRRRC